MTPDLEHRKIPISISLSPKEVKEIDDFMRKNGYTSRTQLVKKMLKRQIKLGENSDRKNVYSERQVRDYHEDYERHLRLCKMEEVRKHLPFIRHTFELANGLTRTPKVDISKITERNPLERMRLEGLRKWREFHDAHEVAPVAAELELTCEYPIKMSKAVAKHRAKIDAEEIELNRLAEDTGNKISERFRQKHKLRTETNIDTDTEIIEEREIRNPYDKDRKETVLQ